jgi:hypothetical protein
MIYVNIYSKHPEADVTYCSLCRAKEDVPGIGAERVKLYAAWKAAGIDGFPPEISICPDCADRPEAIMELSYNGIRLPE